MRDFEKHPYSPDELRVAKWFFDKGGVGGGDDPIGSMIASHEALAAERNQLLRSSAVNDVPKVWRVDHDGFEGVEIGFYRTREGKEGAVLQQLGSRVVHVYGRKWLKPVEPTDVWRKWLKPDV